MAHADTVVKFGPVMPKLIAIWPAPTFGMPIGTRNGLMRSGPRRTFTVMPSTRVPTPPRPVPRMTPVRSARSPSKQAGNPAWSIASRRHQPEGDVAVGAALVLAVEHTARVEFVHLAGDLRRTARRVEGLDPANAGSAGDEVVQLEATSLPSGVSPMPVTTTRRFIAPPRTIILTSSRAHGGRAIDVPAGRVRRSRWRRQARRTRCA